jgi:hypothetical protein
VQLKEPLELTYNSNVMTDCEHCKREEEVKGLTILHTNHDETGDNGKCFFFNGEAFFKHFGIPKNEQIMWVCQYRAGKKVWEGEIRVFLYARSDKNQQEPYGCKVQPGEQRDFEKGDVLKSSYRCNCGVSAIKTLSRDKDGTCTTYDSLQENLIPPAKPQSWYFHFEREAYVKSFGKEPIHGDSLEVCQYRKGRKMWEGKLLLTQGSIDGQGWNSIQLSREPREYTQDIQFQFGDVFTPKDRSGMYECRQRSSEATCDFALCTECYKVDRKFTLNEYIGKYYQELNNWRYMPTSLKKHVVARTEEQETEIMFQRQEWIEKKR